MITKDFDLNDVFLMSEIIEKMDIQFDIDTIIKKTNVTKLENKQDAAELGKDVLLSIGLDLATNLIKRMYKAQKEVKQLDCQPDRENDRRSRENELKRDERVLCSVGNA